ncbi:MAG: polysaccharide biosynthesis tyrosine autokinase [gamma proteobacterium symbiont of Bathyaustriella thionipta]|nr:polysaccharide biosynthesis tyrosine autokinase [gamma proteobacterium symbiont of Bathyaustriella thionipta]
MNRFEEPSDSSEFGLLDYVRVARRHLWGIFGLGLVGLAIAISLAFRMTPVYKADATLVVEPNNTGFSLDKQYVSSSAMWLFYETQYTIIKSRAVAEGALDSLDLLDKRLAEEKKQKARADDSSILDTLKEQFGIQKEAEKPQTPEQHRSQLRSRLIAAIANSVKVKGGKRSEIIRISYESSKPQEAADIVNAVAQAYIAYGLSERSSGAQQDTSFLDEQLKKLKANLDRAEADLYTFQKAEGMVDTSQQSDIVSAKLSGLSSEYIKAQTTRSEAEIRYNQALRIKKAGASYDSLGAVINNPTVQAMHSDVNAAERKLQELSERYGNKHPKIISAKADLKQTQRALNAAINKVIESLRKEYDVALSQERRIERLIKKQKIDVSQLRGKAFKLAKLEREVNDNREIYESFLKRFKKEDIAGEYQVSNARILDAALLPEAPFKPNKARMILIGGILGLLLGFGFALLREKLDNTFRTTEQLEDKLQLPVLGVVPLLKKLPKDKAAEKHVANEPRSTFAEAINHVRTGLLLSDIDHPPQVLLVTSSVSGEGKTTLSSNLAITCSQLAPTLLVEADLRKPRFGSVFPETLHHAGLTEVVSGQTSLQEALQHETSVPNLFVLNSGTRPPNPLEFVSSDAFKKILAALREKFTYIIVDAPPLLAVADALVLATLVDGTILNVQSESTTHKMASDSVRRLRQSGAHVMGSVLAQDDSKRMAYYGSHYYHYYDAYYSDDAKA